MNKLLRSPRLRQNNVEVQSYRVADSKSPFCTPFLLSTLHLCNSKREDTSAPSPHAPLRPPLDLVGGGDRFGGSDTPNESREAHSWRAINTLLAGAAAAPTLSIADSFSSAPMSTNGTINPPTTNGVDSGLSPSAARTPGSRSASLQRRFTPMRVDGSPQNGVNGIPPQEDDARSDDGSAWNHGAIGPAAGGGKTGRVIAKLQSDNDRLNRELRSERMYLEEAESENRVYKDTVETLRAESSNLKQAKEVDEGIIKRRDRQIEDLRAELEVERSRRLAAEKASREAMQQKNDTVSNMQAEVQREKEIAKHSTSHADVLAQSHKQLNAEYKQRIDTFKGDLEWVVRDREEELAKVKRLDVVNEQLVQEVERANRTNTRVQELYAAHKDQASQTIKQLHAEAAKMQHEYDSVVGKAERLVEEVQWLVSIKKMHEDGTFEKNRVETEDES